MSYVMSYREASRRNIIVRGMEDVHDARFGGVKVAARVRRDACTRMNALLSFNLAFNLQPLFYCKKTKTLQLLHSHISV
jgi:hypothetical protein